MQDPRSPSEEGLLLTLIDNAPYGAVLTRGNDVLYFNRRAVELLGYTLDDLPTMEVAFTTFYPDSAYREQVVGRWFSEQLGSSPAPEQVARVRCKDGSDKHVSFAPPVSLPDGRLFTAFTDVTERELAREALSSREAILDALAKSARDFVVYRIRVEPEQPFHGVVEFVTDSLTELFLLSDPKDYSTWFEHVHPDDLQGVAAANEHSARTGARFDEEVRVRHPDGNSWRWIHSIANPVLDSDGRLTHFTGLLVDITDRKRAKQEQQELQAKVQRARELEALGTLAAGVAHDFNNLLMAIEGCVSVALADGTGSGRGKSMLGEVQRQVRRGAELTGHLLAGTRNGSYEVTPLDLAVVVAETTLLFQRTNRQLAIHVTVPDEPVWIAGNRTQLDRVLLNIFVNAAEAMQGQGELGVELQTGIAAAPVPATTGCGEYARLSIRDTGCGMDGDSAARVFEPFFTTKPLGAGTGLGLSTAYQIVRAHGGHVDVESTLGVGTVFNLWLPLRDADARASGQGAGVVPGSGTVLAVDDEPMVLSTVVMMLEDLGYEVLTAASGVEALNIYRAKRAVVDLVILDIVMPGMGGVELYRKLRELDPTVRVLFSSGRPLDALPSFDRESEQLMFVRKPYTLADLSQQMFRALTD